LESEADPELPAPQPVHGQGRPVQGQAVRIPDDWGFDAVLYRKDKVHPKARSWNLLFDERYKGKIAWFDDLEMITIAGLVTHAKNPGTRHGRAQAAR
jgi:spermidine/putrescine-binding protein